MHRGARRAPIFVRDADCVLLLDTLGDVVDRFGLEVDKRGQVREVPLARDVIVDEQAVVAVQGDALLGALTPLIHKVRSE